jgi:hypothetical protein
MISIKFENSEFSHSTPECEFHQPHAVPQEAAVRYQTRLLIDDDNVALQIRILFINTLSS